MFRRRSKVEDIGEGAREDEGRDRDSAVDGAVDASEPASAAAAEPLAAEPPAAEQVTPPRPPERPTGPIDVADLPDEDEVARIDLGSLHIPVPEGLEVRVDVQDDTIVAATVVDGRSELQVHAFAAPRSSGLWTEVRGEIAESLRESGGSAEDAAGPFGPELRARVPVEGGSPQPARFIGVDGPRWFLRGLVTGPAATDPAQAGRLELAFRGIAVHRGSEAMAPRDMLPLRLPPDVTAQEPPQQAPNHSLDLFERGPEITEIQ